MKSHVGHQMVNEIAWSHRSQPIVERAQGCYLWDIQGHQILDGNSGLQNVHIGHGRPEMGRIAAQQIERLDFFPIYNGTHVVVEELAHRLHGLLPHLERFYFMNSGSEAMEVGIKLVKEYWSLRGEPQRSVLIARKSSYHGSTLAALSATGISSLRDPFAEILVEAAHVSDPIVLSGETPEDASRRLLRELEQTIEEVGHEKILGIVADPVQLWGVNVPPPDYWPGLRGMCNTLDIPLIADEIITGFGRTGTWFGLDHWNVTADVVGLGKGLASGYAPISAVGIASKITEVFDERESMFHHISTTSGHPLAAALALENLEIIDQEGLLELAKEKGQRLRELLSDAFGGLPYVEAIRGIGLLNSVVFAQGTTPSGLEANAQLRSECIERGAYLRADGQLWLIPPLIVDVEQMEQLVDIAAAATAAWVEG